ncbi:MAG: flagellar biosynthesis protein FlhF [Bdellovibrionota bacterium]
MQVKKFEARTMKEALEMVKSQLGPEAIILSARDNHRSFGLVGEGSVEITAAISEESLQKRRFTQSKLGDQDKERFDKSSARAQRALIEQVVQNHTQKNQYRPITSQRYIEIDETEAQTALIKGNPVLSPAPELSAQVRIKDAAQRAWQAMNLGTTPNPPKPTPSVNNESDIIRNLQSEITGLKNILNQFQNVPQTFAAQHPGAAYGLNYELSFLFEKLKDEGVGEPEIIELLESVQHAVPLQHSKNKSLLEGILAKKMMEKTLIADGQVETKFHFFFGSSGSGKTSSLVKMASHKVVNENKKVALITTDTYKVGAAEQLKIFAQILNIPFATIRQPQDWVKLRKHFEQIDHVFVDFPGYNLKRADEVQNLEALVPASLKDVTRHLVLSALSKFEDLNDITLRYRQFEIDNLIFNSIDQSVQFGNIYTLMSRQKLPLHSFGIGPRLPEDFEYATKERLLDLIFKITKNNQTRIAVGESR